MSSATSWALLPVSTAHVTRNTVPSPAPGGSWAAGRYARPPSSKITTATSSSMRSTIARIPHRAHPELRPVGTDRHRAIDVGPIHCCTYGVEGVERSAVGMPERIHGPRGDHRHAGGDRLPEHRRAPGGVAVMRPLQDGTAQVSSFAQEYGLGQHVDVSVSRTRAAPSTSRATTEFAWTS